MTFAEALKKLDIEEYGDRIFNSNSHGELFHLMDYITIAKTLKTPKLLKEFKEWFEKVVKFAELEWNRPESIFQHILKMLQEG